MRIIPAIDIIDGKCVRLTKGDYNTRKTYHDNPLDVAREFEANGIRYLHLVDLDGARSKHIFNHRVLHQIATKTSLKIDFGGGIKSDEDARIAFENGAAQITGGSIAQPAARYISAVAPELRTRANHPRCRQVTTEKSPPTAGSNSRRKM